MVFPGYMDILLTLENKQIKLLRAAMYFLRQYQVKNKCKIIFNYPGVKKSETSPRTSISQAFSFTNTKAWHLHKVNCRFQMQKKRFQNASAKATALSIWCLQGKKMQQLNQTLIFWSLSKMYKRGSMEITRGSYEHSDLLNFAAWLWLVWIIVRKGKESCRKISLALQLTIAT